MLTPGVVVSLDFNTLCSCDYFNKICTTLSLSILCHRLEKGSQRSNTSPGISRWLDLVVAVGRTD